MPGRALAALALGSVFSAARVLVWSHRLSVSGENAVDGELRVRDWLVGPCLAAVGNTAPGFSGRRPLCPPWEQQSRTRASGLSP